MKRREFVATMGAAVATGLAGCSAGSGVNPEVSIFMTEKLHKRIDNNSSQGTPEEYADSVRKFVDERLSGVSTEERKVDPKVSTGKLDVNQDRIANSETEDPLGYWNDDIYNLVPEEEVSKHSNLLLCEEMPHPKKGYGEYPNCCNRVVPTSMVYDVRPYFSEVEENIEYYGPGYSRLVSLHEICHNLGLNHSMGKIEKEREGVFSVTPMMAGYIDKFSGEQNHFEKEMPEIPKGSDVLYKTELNGTIKPTTLDLHM